MSTFVMIAMMLIIMFVSHRVTRFIRGYLQPLLTRNATTRPIPMAKVVSDEGSFGDICTAGSLQEYLAQVHKELASPVVCFIEDRKPVVSISDPALWSPLSVVPFKTLIFAEAYASLFTQDSMYFARGFEPRKRRIAYDKCLRHETAQGSFQYIEKCAQDMVKQWLAQKRSVHLQQDLCFAVMKAVATSTFGVMFDDDKLIHDMLAAYNRCGLEMDWTIVHNAPSSDAGAFIRKQFQKAIDVTKKEAKVKREPTYLTAMVDSGYASEEIVGDCAIFLVEGYEALVNHLAWMLYLVAARPDVQEKLRNELRHVCEDTPLSQVQLASLPYHTCVVKECLRFSQAGSFAVRFSQEDLEIGQFYTPPNASIVMPIGLALMDPAVWPGPETFNPDRFAKDNFTPAMETAFQPFGIGRRSCMGQEPAMMESIIFLSSLLGASTLSVPDSSDAPVGRIYKRVGVPSRPLFVTLSPLE